MTSSQASAHQAHIKLVRPSINETFNDFCQGITYYTDIAGVGPSKPFPNFMMSDVTRRPKRQWYNTQMVATRVSVSAPGRF